MHLRKVGLQVWRWLGVELEKTLGNHESKKWRWDLAWFFVAFFCVELVVVLQIYWMWVTLVMNSLVWTFWDAALVRERMRKAWWLSLFPSLQNFSFLPALTHLAIWWNHHNTIQVISNIVCIFSYTYINRISHTLTYEIYPRMIEDFPSSNIKNPF